MIDPPEQRALVRNYALMQKHNGMSQYSFEKLIEDNEAYILPEVKESLKALKERKELEHLIILVWTFKKGR